MKSSMVLFEVLLENILFSLPHHTLRQKEQGNVLGDFYDQLRYAIYSFIGLFMKAILRKIPLFFSGIQNGFFSLKRENFIKIFSRKSSGNTYQFLCSFLSLLLFCSWFAINKIGFFEPHFMHDNS